MQIKLQLCWLGLEGTQTASVMRGEMPVNRRKMRLQSGALENLEYPFIAITLRSILTQRGSDC